MTDIEYKKMAEKLELAKRLQEDRKSAAEIINQLSKDKDICFRLDVNGEKSFYFCSANAKGYLIDLFDEIYAKLTKDYNEL